MKFDDSVLGVIIFIFGVTIIYLSSGFETLRHISYGPGFFPTIIGAGFVLCGSLLVGRRILAGVPWGKWVELGDWSRSPRHIVNFFLVPVSVVLYILFSDVVGFFLSMILLLSVQIAWFTRQIWKSIAIALLVTLFLQVFFQGFMSVPLPWGVFERFAGVLTWM